MSKAKLKYLDGRQPHPREHRMIFRNVDRKGWKPTIRQYLDDGGYEQLRKAISTIAWQRRRRR